MTSLINILLWLVNRGIYLTYFTLFSPFLTYFLCRNLQAREITRDEFRRPSLSRLSNLPLCWKAMSDTYFSLGFEALQGKLTFTVEKIDDNICYYWRRWWLNNHQDLWNFSNIFLSLLVPSNPRFRFWSPSKSKTRCTYCCNVSLYLILRWWVVIGAGNSDSVTMVRKLHTHFLTPLLIKHYFWCLNV